MDGRVKPGHDAECVAAAVQLIGDGTLATTCLATARLATAMMRSLLLCGDGWSLQRQIPMLADHVLAEAAARFA